ncbi:hypothetical protein ACFLTC_01805 [Chloroflexota bacterium]
MRIRSYEPEILLLPFDFGREMVNVIGHFSTDISLVLPYLNAPQPGAIYPTAAPTLRFRFEGT